MELSGKELNRIVADSFGIRDREVVLVMGPERWMRAVAIECKKIGAFTLLYRSPSRSSRQRARMPSRFEFQSITSEQLPAVVEEIDAWVQIRLPLARRARTKRIAKNQAKATIPSWLDRIRERGVRQCEFTVPGGPPRFRDAVAKALKADVNGMVVLGKKLRRSFGSVKDVHVTTKQGTDLNLALNGKHIAVDCGRWDPDLQIDNIAYVPSGVIETVPINTSANGLVVVPRAYLRWAHSGWIKKLQLQFESGKVRLETVRSESGLCIFKRILEGATGDKDMIAEFSIGVNPNVRDLIGCMTVDELMGGSTHIAIGDNYWWMNGKNKSSLHWDFILPEATVELDGKAILDRGKFLVS